MQIITNEIAKYHPKLPIEWDDRFPVVLSDVPDSESDLEPDKVKCFIYLQFSNNIFYSSRLLI